MELTQIKTLIKDLESLNLDLAPFNDQTDLLNELKYAVTIASFDSEPSQFINKNYVIYCRCGEKAKKVNSLFTCGKCG